MLESDTGAATETEVDGRPAYLLGQPGGPRLWVAADGSGTLLRAGGPEERTVRPRLHRLGPRPDVHRAAPAAMVVEG